MRPGCIHPDVHLVRDVAPEEVGADEQHRHGGGLGREVSDREGEAEDEGEEETAASEGADHDARSPKNRDTGDSTSRDMRMS